MKDKVKVPNLGLTFEEFEVGQVFPGPGISVTEADIINFARDWDPQPFHIDRVASEQSAFGQIVGSGLHTLMLSYWLHYQSGILRGTALAGLGLDEIRFLNPLLPGATLSINTTIIEKTPSSRPGQGKIKLRIDTKDHYSEPVFHMTLHALVVSSPPA